MVRLYVRHNVGNTGKWMRGYLENSKFRDDHQVIAEGVHQNIDDPTDLTVWHDFRTVEAAKAFAALPELKAAMRELGVIGQPSVWITRESSR